jgi:hypothetical protein
MSIKERVVTKEEQAVRMWLLDKSQEEQEFYREEMFRMLETFKDDYDITKENLKELYVAAIAMAVVKFTEYVESKQ